MKVLNPENTSEDTLPTYKEELRKKLDRDGKCTLCPPNAVENEGRKRFNDRGKNKRRKERKRKANYLRIHPKQENKFSLIFGENERTRMENLFYWLSWQEKTGNWN